MEKLVCKACSNGCILSIEDVADGEVLVLDNKCLSGVAYAHSELKEQYKGKFLPAEAVKYEEEYLAKILKKWSKELDKALPGEFIQGSPNRSLFRTVVLDLEGKKYVLEQIDINDHDAKENIANTIQYLSLLNIPVNAYLRNNNDQFLVDYDSKSWILSQYIAGDKIDRNNYWNDSWRGEALAEFLADLYRETCHFKFENAPFSLVEYIEDLLDNVKKNKPEIVQVLEEIVSVLREKLFSKYGSMPLCFCHGDPHPMNMIWEDRKIKAAIDWEFCGPKPALYDAALIIGCVGAEDPESRNGKLLTSFKEALIDKKVIRDDLLPYLPIFTVATRFGWLTEWLMADDKEMIEFEINYMKLLLDEIED